MSAHIHHPSAHAEGGFLQNSLRVVAEVIGGAALGSTALIAASLAFTEAMYDFDEHLDVPFDNEEDLILL